MRELCIIGLLVLIAPWITGIMICLFKFFGEKVEKVCRWFELRKDERQKMKCLKEYQDWYISDQQAILKAHILNNRYERSQLFTKEDFKIWKAFI